jgi:alpha-galactosidase
MASPELVQKWGFALTPVSWRIQNRERLIQKAKDYRDGTQILNPIKSGEEGIKIMKALSGLDEIVTNVNMPNRGQMPDMPLGAVVETNASFRHDSIQPLVTKGLPNGVRTLTMPHVLAQEGIIEAVFEDDREKAFKVFSLDGAVQKLPLGDARTLFNQMCEKTLK